MSYYFSLFGTTKIWTLSLLPHGFATMLRCINLALFFCVVRFCLVLNPLYIFASLQQLKAQQWEQDTGILFKRKEGFLKIKGTWLEFLESLSLRLAQNSFNSILSRWRNHKPQLLITSFKLQTRTNCREIYVTHNSDGRQK